MWLMDIALVLTAFPWRLNVFNIDSSYPISDYTRQLDNYRPEELGFMVLVVVEGFGVCTGSLISMQWVVTAAHCVETVQAAQVTLRAGYIEPEDQDKPQEWQQTRECRRLVVFPSHVRLLFDMALAWSHQAFEDTVLVQPLPLCRNWQFPRRGELCVAAGWEVRDASQRHFLRRHVLVHVLNNHRCRDYWGVRLHRSVVCAKAEDGGSLCFGDSGAPLVCRGLLAGVAKALVDAEPSRDELLRAPQELHQVACGGNRTFMTYTAVGLYRRWLGSYVVGMRLDWLGHAPLPRPGLPIHLLCAASALFCLSQQLHTTL